MLRFSRVGSEALRNRVVQLVKGLREREFLKGTPFEERCLKYELDPYSVLAGFLLGVATTMVVGFLTFDVWAPRVIARITGKTIEEAARAVREVLAG